MTTLFVAVPWFIHKVIARPRPTLLPPSAPSCAALVVGVAVLGYLTQHSTDPELVKTWGNLTLLFAIILLFTVGVTSSWLRPLRNQQFHLAKPTFIVGRATFILLSVAVVAWSAQLNPVDLGRSGWNIVELVSWLTGWMGAISLLGLLVLAGVTHYRDRKSADAEE